MYRSPDRRSAYGRPPLHNYEYGTALGVSQVLTVKYVRKHVEIARGKYGTRMDITAKRHVLNIVTQ